MGKRVMEVLIADDEPQVRSALRLLLKQVLGVDVAGEADHASEALKLVSKHRPGLVLLDWELPDCGGAAALAELRTVQPDLKIIALSGRPEARRAAQEAGVDAFVSKGDPPECLLAAFRAVCGDVVRGIVEPSCPAFTMLG